MLQKFARGLLQKNAFKFSGGYFSHKETQTNNDSTPFEFTADNYKEVEKILTKYPSNWKRSAIIPLLTLAQKQNDNFLSLSAMRKVARITEVNEMDVYEVASFYTMFNRERVGKFHLQICGTTPCQLRGSEAIIAACEKHLGIKSGETTKDNLFTIQEVECLGACANAPMLQVNGEWVYEDLTPENTIELLEKLKTNTAKKGPQINRNDCEGPQGRTTLIVHINLQRASTSLRRSDSIVIS
jgi:NADH dehydrogenase (ubiquinone) flavoprotein 2